MTEHRTTNVVTADGDSGGVARMDVPIQTSVTFRTWPDIQAKDGTRRSRDPQNATVSKSPGRCDSINQGSISITMA